MAMEPEDWRRWFRRQPSSKSRIPSRATWRSLAWRVTTREPTASSSTGRTSSTGCKRSRRSPRRIGTGGSTMTPNPRARDKIISKWGGFLEDIPFDPVTFGITPNSLLSIEPLQLYLLEAARRALADAGYSDRPFPRERTASILGIGGGGSPLAVQYGFRTCLPLLETVPGLALDSNELMDKCRPLMPEWTEDSFPGILMNVAVGRIANRFNLGGPNYAIDAACGSSLAAVYACIRELQVGTSDVAIALGADTVQTPYAYMAFSKTHALSPKGRCRPFDAAADGIVLSEGVGAVILKRLADAERDGDRIYGVIKGMGASSDGRDKGLTAPRLEGQLRALRRAYGQARVSPSQVGLIEAHGTGTVVGDQTEAQALIQLMREAQAAPQSCAVGSVKSMIGHTKCAAGIAGLIKTTLALHHRVLPPTLVETPNPKGDFEEGVLYLNTEPRPWVHGAPITLAMRGSAPSASAVRTSTPSCRSTQATSSTMSPRRRRAGRRNCWSGRVLIGRRCDPRSSAASNPWRRGLGWS